MSADHRAIAWCQQVIVPAAETFLDVAAMDDTGDVAARIALAAVRLGDESLGESESAANTGKILRLVLNRTPSLVPIMLALAIDALVVPQTVRAGGFRVEGSAPYAKRWRCSPRRCLRGRGCFWCSRWAGFGDRAW